MCVIGHFEDLDTETLSPSQYMSTLNSLRLHTSTLKLGLKKSRVYTIVSLSSIQAFHQFSTNANMSGPTAKKLKTHPSYELLYHPGVSYPAIMRS